MDRSEGNAIAEYIQAVQALNAQVQRWLSDLDELHCITRSFHIDETTGSYEAPGLAILGPGDTPIAEMAPVGMNIVAAKGRVDLAGEEDRAPLLWLEPPSPVLTSEIDAGGLGASNSRPLFEGVDSEGWYWIENRLARRAHLLDRDLFRDLLLGVSGHVLSR